MPTSMRFCTFASGSSGNMAYFGNPQGAVLIDAGISGKHLASCLTAMDVAPQSIAGLLLTHSHGDHIRCAGIAARKFGFPLFMTPGTSPSVMAQLTGKEPYHIIRNDATFQLGGFAITPIPTPHDAPGAVCYVLEYDGIRVGLFTDMGHVFDEAKRILPTLDAVILESNHDPKMLRQCDRPPATKARIAGNRGHLSNEESASLVRDFASPRLRAIVLAHLSDDNNRPSLALDKHTTIAADFHTRGKPLIEVAPRQHPSRMIVLHPFQETTP